MLKLFMSIRTTIQVPSNLKNSCLNMLLVLVFKENLRNLVDMKVASKKLQSESSKKNKTPTKQSTPTLTHNRSNTALTGSQQNLNKPVSPFKQSSIEGKSPEVKQIKFSCTPSSKTSYSK